MSKRRSNRFAAHWASQSQLGAPFGLSAIAVGRILAEAGLRDPTAKAPTDEALANGIAKSTPMRDGTAHYMWSREKTRHLFAGCNHIHKAERYANELRKKRRQLQRMADAGDDKLAHMAYEALYDEVPKRLRTEVQRLVEED